MKKVLMGVFAATLCAAPAMAQQMPAKPSAATQSLMAYYTAVKPWLIKAAADVSEADYGFRPQTAPAADKAQIRTFGQLIGHVADAQYMFCGAASGMAAPAGAGSIEKTKTAKADLQKALADSFAFCDKAWAGTTDANASTPVKLPEALPLPPMTRLSALVFNTEHDAEHYGNVVTYMRAKGLVPPSSQPMPAK